MGSGGCAGAAKQPLGEPQPAIPLPPRNPGQKLVTMLRGHEHFEEDGDRGVRALSADAYSVSDVGCERELNEDRFETVSSPGAITWIVCDGMGGADGGEYAAQLAIDAMARRLQASQGGEPNVDSLANAFREANRVIVLRRQNREFAGMGTTAVAVRFDGSELVICSVGDTRAYLVRDGAVQQLTVDDTYVQSLVDDGKITPDEAMSHPQAHVLTRCLGSEPNLNIHTQRLWLWPAEAGADGDILLLCSDGLYSLVPDVEIGAVVSSLDTREACDKLVELARERGGFDNITVSIIPFAGSLRQSRPIPMPAPQAPEPKPRHSRRGRDRVLRHAIFVGILSGLFACATVAGLLALRFLR